MRKGKKRREVCAAKFDRCCEDERNLNMKEERKRKRKRKRGNEA